MKRMFIMKENNMQKLNDSGNNQNTGFYSDSNQNYWSTGNFQILNEENVNPQKNYWYTDNAQSDFELNSSYWATD